MSDIFGSKSLFTTQMESARPQQYQNQGILQLKPYSEYEERVCSLTQNVFKLALVLINAKLTSFAIQKFICVYTGSNILLEE